MEVLAPPSAEAYPNLFLPTREFPELYHDVAMALGHAMDGKWLIDSMPRFDLDTIRNMHELARLDPSFDPVGFWYNCFEVPDYGNTLEYNPAENTLDEHIIDMWGVLAYHQPQDHGTLIGTQFPHLKSGRRYNEGYYWDLFNGFEGLLLDAERDPLQLERAWGILRNCANLIDRFGFIPNGLRSYYLTRSQPPKFARMVKLMSVHFPEATEEFLPQVTREYNWWMKGVDQLDPERGIRAADHVVLMPDGSILNRYWDTEETPRDESYFKDIETAEKLPAPMRNRFFRNVRAMGESGRDMTAEYLADPTRLETAQTTQIVPADLNSLLFEYEMFLSQAHHQAGRSVLAQEFQNRAFQRAAAINKYNWTGDEDTGFYCGFLMNDDFTDGAPTNFMSMTMAYPVARGVAPPQRARSVSRHLVESFLQTGGFVASLTPSGQQWDWPNGWPPDQDEGCNALDVTTEITGEARWSIAAMRARARFVFFNRKVHKAVGKIVEKINVVGRQPINVVNGEYVLQDGFLWTNGVLLKFIRTIMGRSVLAA